MTGQHPHPVRVLFVCTGNSARSIMAEGLLRHHGGDRFEVRSAGTEPKGVNPLTLRVLSEAGIDSSFARSTFVGDLLGESFDAVITVCDQARQSCPVFPGAHDTIHWSHEDPAAVEGTDVERMAAFRRVLAALEEEVRGFVARRQERAA